MSEAIALKKKQCEIKFEFRIYSYNTNPIFDKNKYIILYDMF